MNAHLSNKAALALIAAALPFVTAAQASHNMSESATMTSQASVAEQCVVGNTAQLQFGNLSMLDASNGGRSTESNYANSSFSATCTNGSPTPTFRFTSSNGEGMGFMMRNGNHLMRYSLHEGNQGVGTMIHHDYFAPFGGMVADGTVRTLQISARVTPEDKDGSFVGTYEDTVTITTSFYPI